MEPTQHWDTVYQTKDADEVSWFQPEPTVSWDLIAAADIDRTAPVIDVGGGASFLGRRLMDAGYRDVSLLDISASALTVARERHGFTGNTIVADVRDWQPDRAYALWHDRAVFHFLTDAADRTGYRRTLEAAVAEDGWLVIGTFAEDGPQRCSGLPTARYDADSLAAEFAGWTVKASRREEHRTPWDSVQPFTWLLLSRVSRETASRETAEPTD